MSFTDWLPNRKRASILAGRTRPRPSAASFPRLEALEDRCLLSGGALDPTFGSGGVVNSATAAGAVAFGVATYPQAGSANDGKIVAVGWTYSGGRKPTAESVVARYNVNGTPDTSFAGTGQALAALTVARAVAVQPDGKVLFAGTVGGQLGITFALARYNASGTLDSTFGSGGVVTTPISGTTNDEILAIGLQPDGKIVAAGTIGLTNSNAHELALLRYNSNGGLDTTFGQGGKALDHLPVGAPGGTNITGMGLALDPGTGKVVVEATAVIGRAMVVCYTGGGRLDTAFAGGAGYETLYSLYSNYDVAIQPSDHRIVVAGLSASATYEGLARLLPDGTPDNSFGAGGIVTTSVRAYSTSAQSVTFQADGQILVAATGTDPRGIGPVIIVTRYDPTHGALDTSFGVNGVASVPYSANSQLTDCVGMALEPEGRIVVIGRAASGAQQFVLARFLAAAPQIGSFGASAYTVTAGNSVTLTAGNITDANPGASTTRVAFSVQTNGTSTLLGYGTQTSPGVWTFTFTVSLPRGSYTLFAQAEDSYGAFGDLVALTLTVQ